MSNGAAHMFLSPSGDWQATDHNGNPISFSGTTTQGLQETINFAYGHQCPLVVDGRSANSGNTSPFINCSSTLYFPPGQGMSVVMRNLTINCISSLNTGVWIDSQEMCRIYIHHQIVYGGAGSAVLIKPTNGTPLDHSIAVSPSDIYIHTVAAGPGCQAAIDCDCSVGGFVGNYFRFCEINGGITAFRVHNLSHSFVQNEISATNVHGQTGTVFDLQSGDLRHNIWNISGIRSGATGFKTVGNHDIINIGGITNEEGPLGVGVDLSGGSHNKVTIGGISGNASHPVIYGSLSNSVWGP